MRLREDLDTAKASSGSRRLLSITLVTPGYPRTFRMTQQRRGRNLHFTSANVIDTLLYLDLKDMNLRSPCCPWHCCPWPASSHTLPTACRRRRESKRNSDLGIERELLSSRSQIPTVRWVLGWGEKDAAGLEPNQKERGIKTTKKSNEHAGGPYKLHMSQV